MLLYMYDTWQEDATWDGMGAAGVEAPASNNGVNGAITAA
jgi:hypothetical protein